jgi:cell division septation protein DedD
MSDDVNASGPLYRPSHDDDPGMDSGTLRILILMGIGGVAILAGIALFDLLGHGGAGGPVPVVQANPSPIRVRPLNPGGMVVGAIQKPIDPNDSRLAPPPEEPRPLELATPPAVTPNPEPAIAMARPHGKAITVQLSAARGEGEALMIWNRLTRRMPDLLAHRRPLFQKVTEHGRDPWRLRTGGFVSPAAAKAFCDQVRAKGGSCSLVES